MWRETHLSPPPRPANSSVQASRMETCVGSVAGWESHFLPPFSCLFVHLSSLLVKPRSIAAAAAPMLG